MAKCANRPEEHQKIDISGFVTAEVEQNIPKACSSVSKHPTFATQLYSYQLPLLLIQYSALLWWQTPGFMFKSSLEISSLQKGEKRCKTETTKKFHLFHFFSQIVNVGLESAPSTHVVPQQQIHHSPFRENFFLIYILCQWRHRHCNHLVCLLVLSLRAPPIYKSSVSPTLQR